MIPFSANSTAVYYSVQDSCGEINANPAFTKMRFTGGVPSIARDTLTSSELDGTPEITSVRLGSFNVSNEAGVELSYGNYDDLLESAMQSAWVAGTKSADQTVTIDASAKTAKIDGVDLTSSISVNDLIKLPGLTGYNSEPRLVTSITYTDPDTIITFGSSVAENSQLGISGLADETGTSKVVTNDTLSVGNVRKYLTILVEFSDSDGNKYYDISIDNEATGFNFSVSVNALVTGSISFIGKTYASNTTLPAGATFVNPNDNKPFTGIDGCIAKDGGRLMLSTSAEMTLDRGATPTFELCSKYMSHVTYGKATNSVSISTFFYDYNLQNQFDGEVNGDYTIKCSLDSKAMAFNYPNAIITDLPRDVGEGDITQTATLQPYKPASAASSLIIRRIE